MARAITKPSSTQRAGRVGRTKSGIVARLFLEVGCLAMADGNLAVEAAELPEEVAFRLAQLRMLPLDTSCGRRDQSKPMLANHGGIHVRIRHQAGVPSVSIPVRRIACTKVLVDHDDVETKAKHGDSARVLSILILRTILIIDGKLRLLSCPLCHHGGSAAAAWGLG